VRRDGACTHRTRRAVDVVRVATLGPCTADVTDVGIIGEEGDDKQIRPGGLAGSQTQRTSRKLDTEPHRVSRNIPQDIVRDTLLREPSINPLKVGGVENWLAIFRLGRAQHVAYQLC
jgi:hypothetical protein